MLKDLVKNLKPSFTKNNTDEDIKKIIPNPGYWFRKNTNLEKLKKLNSKLSSNTNYKVLNSYSWIQNIENKEISKYLFEKNTENILCIEPSKMNILRYVFEVFQVRKRCTRIGCIVWGQDYGS